MPMAASTIDARGRQNVLRLVLAGCAALCLPAYLTRGGRGLRSFDDDGAFEKSRAEWEEDARFHRLLYEASDDPSSVEGYEELAMPAWLRDAVAEPRHAAAHLRVALDAAEAAAPPVVRYPHPTPYALADVVDSSRRFANTFAMIVYDNELDDFLFLYNNARHNWVSGNAKLTASFRSFAYMLRKTFPERFCGKECDELVFGMGSGDYPHLAAHCLASFPHTSPACPATHAPIFQFGSVFRNSEIAPNVIPMPMPEGHNLACFKNFVVEGGAAVCAALQPKDPETYRGNLVFGEERGLEFENLAPQVVWRGTDFGYLTHITMSSLRMPGFEWDIVSPLEKAGNEVSDTDDKKAIGTRLMREKYDTMLPRWKGVILTGEAEYEAAQKKNQGDEEALPRFNMKFTGASVMAKHPQAYDKFAEYGIPALGGRMSLEELATRRYQIDLGGGGGTTWSGTIHKLAMPGLLFHHVTPTKDYIHDHMVPWVHYVPVAPDLSDLKEKYEWAESHPEAAKMIAERGSALMRRLGTLEGFREMFEQDFTDPVRRVLEAYQPVSKTHPGKTWREVLEEFSPGEMEVMRRCDGSSPTKKACNF